MIRAPSNPTRIGVNRWRMRFALLGGGVAWLLHLLLAYVIAEFGVLSGFARTTWAGGLSATLWLLLGLSVAMAFMAAAATWVAWGLRTPQPKENEIRDTLRFCARFGLGANLTFLAIIAAQSIPLLYFLPP